MPWVEGITRFCFAASYTVALIAEIVQLFRPRWVPRWLARFFGTAGLFAHSVFLVMHQPSPASPQGSLLLLAWVVAIFYLYGSLHYRRVVWGVFVLPVVLILLALAEAVMHLGPGDPVFAEVSWFSGERFWGNVHGTLMLLAAVGVSVAFVASVMYLIQAARLRNKSITMGGMRLLNLERLETMNRRAVNWAFPLWSAGLLLGVYLLRGSDASASEWATLKIVSTAGLWVVFLLLMYLRYGVHLPGRRLALLSMMAFGLMLVTFAASHPLLQEGVR